jgi:hypothetical protein
MARGLCSLVQLVLDYGGRVERGMLITYRRTGGMLSLLIAAVVLVATALTIAVGAVILFVGAAIGAVVLLVRSALPKSWRRRRGRPVTPWPQETIEATVVNPAGSVVEDDVVRRGHPQRLRIE